MPKATSAWGDVLTRCDSSRRVVKPVSTMAVSVHIRLSAWGQMTFSPNTFHRPSMIMG